MSQLADTTNPRATGAPGEGGVLERLLTRGWEFDFFQAAWLLERCWSDRTPVGQRGPVGREGLRFRPDVSLGFPPTDVRRITECQAIGSDETYSRVDVTFLGLYGVATPLPLHYAVSILRSVEPEDADEAESAPVGPPSARDREPGSAPARDFLDLLHHRLISLFYRAWTKYRYHVTFGMPDRDVITDYLLWLIGCGPGWTAEQAGVSPIRLIRYAGILTQHPRSALTLEQMLYDYWAKIPIRVEQFLGRWVTLAPEDINSVGALNSRLGVDLTVGEQVFDLAGAFSIAIGPVDWETYVSFLPDGERFGETVSLVRFYCADPSAFDVMIRVRPGEIPETRLGSDDTAGRLGYSSWVRTDDMPETSVTFDTSLTAFVNPDSAAPDREKGT